MNCGELLQRNVVPQHVLEPFLFLLHMIFNQPTLCKLWAEFEFHSMNQPEELVMFILCGLGTAIPWSHEIDNFNDKILIVLIFYLFK